MVVPARIAPMELLQTLQITKDWPNVLTVAQENFLTRIMATSVLIAQKGSISLMQERVNAYRAMMESIPMRKLAPVLHATLLAACA